MLVAIHNASHCIEMHAMHSDLQDKMQLLTFPEPDVGHLLTDT